MKALITRLTAITTVAAAFAGCVVHQTEAPALTGPSGLAMSLTLTATPDSISQNGGDQSFIRIIAVGPNGQPIAGLPLRLQTEQNGVLADFGTLSARNVVTASDGTASVVFTAPVAPPAGSTIGTCQPTPAAVTLAGNCVTIVATPTGSNFSTETPQSVTIRLVPPGIIVPPVKVPKATFTITPSAG